MFYYMHATGPCFTLIPTSILTPAFFTIGFELGFTYLYIYIVELLVVTQFKYQLGLAKSLSDSKSTPSLSKSMASTPLDCLLTLCTIFALHELHSVNQSQGFGSRVTLLIASPNAHALCWALLMQVILVYLACP